VEEVREMALVSFCWTAAGIAAGAACFSALIALWGFWRQNRSYKRALGLQLAIKVSKQFDGSKFQKLRASVAGDILNHFDNPTAPCELEKVDDLFDFFETLGYFTKEKYLTEELVHHFFFHWVNLYWIAGQEYVEQK